MDALRTSLEAGMPVRTTYTRKEAPQIDVHSATAALGFLVQKMQNRDFHRLFKALYLADLMHLEKYGRPIAWEQFSALEYGPVPMTVYNSLCALRGDTRFPIANEDLHAKLEELVEVVNRKYVQLLRAPDLEDLSDSDVACLEEAARIADANTFDDNTYLTHDEAYEAAWSRRPNGPIRLDDILNKLPNGDEIRKHLEHNMRQ